MQKTIGPRRLAKVSSAAQAIPAVVVLFLLTPRMLGTAHGQDADVVAGVDAAAPAEAAEAVPEAAEAAAPAEAVEAVPEAAEAAEAVPEAAEAAAVSASEGGERITVTLDNMDVAEVVNLFIRNTGANIIAATTNLKGTVTANLNEVPWTEALESILEPHKLVLNKKPSGVYVIEAVPAGAPEPWITEVFPLSYLKAGEAAELLKSLLGLGVEDTAAAARKPAGAQRAAMRPEDEAPKEEVAVVFRKDGRVVSYPAGNAVVVSTTRQKMEEVRQVLQETDRPRPQVYIEAKIVELQGDAAKKIGVDWSMLDAYGLGMGGTMDADGNLTPLRRDYKSSRIRERGSAKYRGGENAAAWDARGRPLHSATATDPTAATASPIDGIGEPGTGTDGSYVNSFSATPGAALVEGWNKANGTWRAVNDTRTAVFSADVLQVVLSALETSEDAVVISNPKVIVANEEKAVIDMSTKEPYVEVTRDTEGTGAETTFTYSTEMNVIPGDNETLPYIEEAFFTYGIKLIVTPRVNNASNITVAIEPTISNLQGYYLPAGIGMTRYPIIDIKRVRTIFSLGDGKTAVIGGLTTTADVEVVKKVPLLGDIPLLGKYLFSHTATEKRQRETVIFVTVGIVGADAATTRVGAPEASKLIPKHVTPDGRLIDAGRAGAEVTPALADEGPAAAAPPPPPAAAE